MPKRVIKRYLLSGVLLIAISCASVSKAPEITNTPPEQSPVEEQNQPLKSGEIASYIVEELLKNVDGTKKYRAGVLNFTDVNAKKSEVGKLLAKKIISELTSSKRVTVVEREHLARILEEQKLNMSGITTEENQEVGTVLSVDVLISGTVTRLRDGWAVTAKITDVATGEIYGAVGLKAETGLLETGISEEYPLSEGQPARKSLTGGQAERKWSGYPGVRQELSRLKRKNPAAFREITRLLHKLKRMKEKHPHMFLLVTEPPGSKKLHRIKRESPLKFKRIKNIRKGVGFAITRLPSLKGKLLHERRGVIRRVSGKAKRRANGYRE